MVSFILLDLFTNNEAMVILIVIILGSIDFWVTKNISGRKLVGLRWWNQIKPNGQEVWRFESKNESKKSMIYIIIKKINQNLIRVYFGLHYIQILYFGL